ncbi:BRO-N domain-containing protein [Providencia stuartii]|uniref:BRO-N domain-containing protein n=1 Tax=Providencia stuartii TaxID=588 RepID=UPI0034E3D427
MNSITKNDLTFQNFTFNPIVENGQVWLTSTEIAQVLGYSRTDNVSKLYARNADEFTDSMTMTVNMTFNGINNSLRNKSVRVYSLRGAHLIAMFASTPVAKEFRKWVLDILDKEVEEKQNLPTTRQKSVSTDGLLARLNLICDTWDLAKDDIAVFDPKMANRLGATMNMFWMYTASMKKIASKKQVRRLTH